MLHKVRVYYNGEYDTYTLEPQAMEAEREALLQDPGVTFAEVDGITIKEPADRFKVWELNRERLKAVKMEYYIHQHEEEGTSWGELANIDDLVPDDTVFTEFAGIEFVADDFTG